MRIHCLENVDKALSFLYEQRVHLENMGAHDIVDGSPRLTLGLIWTIILRFQIQEIIVEEPGPGAVSVKFFLHKHFALLALSYLIVQFRDSSSSQKMTFFNSNLESKLA